MVAASHREPARRRKRGNVWVFLQARVSPETRDLARRGAAARGVTISRYIEELVNTDERALNYEPPTGDAEQLEMNDERKTA